MKEKIVAQLPHALLDLLLEDTKTRNLWFFSITSLIVQVIIE